MRKNYNEKVVDREIDGKFHIYITEAAKNQTLIDVMKLIVLKMQKQKFWQYTKEKSVKSLGHSAIYLKEHASLVDAIKKGEDKTAVKIIKNHLDDVEKDVKRYFG